MIRYSNSCFMSKTFHLQTLNMYKVQTASPSAMLFPRKVTHVVTLQSSLHSSQQMWISQSKPQKDSRPRWTQSSGRQRRPRQLHGNPSAAGLRLGSLLSKARHRHLLVIRKVFHCHLDAGHWASSFEVHATLPRAPQAHSPPSSKGDLGSYC